ESVVEFTSAEAHAARRLQLYLVRRIRIRAPSERAPENHLARRILRDFHAAVHGLPLCYRSHGSDLPDVLRHDWGSDFAVAAWLQLQRSCLGRLHCTVW